jgi:hypothetical protein
MTTEERFEKIEAGIRDLIVVSRTVLDSITELRESQKRTDEKLARTDEKLVSFDEMFSALIQAQRESEERISRLSATVDKLIRFRGPDGQNLK